MGKCLLSIDWDYFICSKAKGYSYIENSKNVFDVWYKRYFMLKKAGERPREFIQSVPRDKGFLGEN